jgi:hypothetical protein
MVKPGQWISYGCLDWGPQLFHADDFQLKERMLACGNVCFFESIEGEYWVLKFGSLRVRLRADLIGAGPLPAPRLTSKNSFASANIAPCGSGAFAASAGMRNGAFTCSGSNRMGSA